MTFKQCLMIAVATGVMVGALGHLSMAEDKSFVVETMSDIPAASSETRVETVENDDGTITETTIVENVTPQASVTLMVTSEVSKMDILKRHDWDKDGDYDHKHTVITIDGLTPDALNKRIGDQDGDGDIDRYDLAAYVGDLDADGDVDYTDYVAKFGDKGITVDYTYNYDASYSGSTAYVQPSEAVKKPARASKTDINDLQPRKSSYSFNK